MGVAYAFGVGVLGALVVYMARFRLGRLEQFLYDVKANWRVLAWDIGIFLLCGGLCVCFILEPNSPKEAFLGGAAWEGLITNIPTKE